MLDSLVGNPVLSALALTLIHFVWQGALIAFGLKLLLVIISNKKPLIRYSLSCVAMVASLVVPVLTFLWCYQLYATDANPNGLANAIAPLMHVNGDVYTNSNLTWYTKLSHYLPYVSILWVSSVVALTLKLLVELFFVTRLPYQQTLPVHKELQDKFYQLVQQLQLKQIPKLVISLKVEVPMAIGWLKPVVLLPANMVTGLSSAQLEMLLLHELAHIRRHDYLVNFLQTLVEILLFFHPAVMWISKQMRQEREYCSDDIAVAHCGNAVAYAHTLADTASICKKHRHSTIPTMAMAASGGDLKERVVRLVDHQCTDNNDAGRWLAGVMLGLSLLLITSKQFLSIPQLTLTADELSLFNFYGKPAKQASTDLSSQESEKELVKTTIAQQLIAKQYKKEKIIVSPMAFSQTKADVHVPKLVKLEQTELQALTSSKNSEITFQNIEPINNKLMANEVNDRTVALTNNESNSLNTSSSNNLEKVEIHEEVIAVANNTRVEKLLAEETPHQNPYAGQIAELALEVDTASPNITAQSSLAESAIPDRNDVQQYISALAKTGLTTEPYEIRVNKSENMIVEVPVKYNAELISASEPRYPSIAKRKGIELDVLVNFTIGKDGRIRNIEFQQQNKVSYFKNAIISAMDKWSFLPAQLDGQPVESKMSKIFSFNLS